MVAFGCHKPGYSLLLNIVKNYPPNQLDEDILIFLLLYICHFFYNLIFAPFSFGTKHTFTYMPRRNFLFIVFLCRHWQLAGRLL